MSRRDFLKETAAIGITAAATAAFWNAAPKSVEAYRGYINARFAVGQPLPRKPKLTGTSDVFMQPVLPMGAMGSSWPEMVINVFYGAGLDTCIAPGDSVSLKLHTGERNRESYLRPHNVKALAAEVKKKGGYPIVMDTTTAYYPSARYQMINYYETALSHGYTAESVGCPVIPWADGYWGADGVLVPIDGNQLNEVHIAQAIAEQDALIAFTHAKGHPSGIIGGTIKNLGIGGASAYGKWFSHYLRGNVTGKGDYVPIVVDVDPFKCVGKAKCTAIKHPYIAGDCTRLCPYKAYEVGENGMTKWDPTICTRNRCMDYYALCKASLPSVGCPAGFTNRSPWAGISGRQQRQNLGIRYADTAVGCTWLFPATKVGFMNIMKDIQPHCDCVSYDGLPLVADIGISGGKDMAALDTAFIDLVQALPPVPGSRADVLKLKAGDEKFEPVNGGNPRLQCEAVERLGAGTREYKITEVKPTLRFFWGTGMPYYMHDQADKMKTFRMGSEKSSKDPRAWYYLE